MLNEFKSFIHQHSLCTETDKILITVSGGADSVVLLHLFYTAGYSIEVAHCNFNLRGDESDGDEAFVRKICEEFNVEGHFISFNTGEYAVEKKISIEMAARDLRYNWFKKLQEKHNYTKIATGHHLNDSIETLFINLLRGTGINGLTGIKPKNGDLIRPLLFATRERIEEYAKLNQLEFRTDSSNASNEYLRNSIRNEIIPAFKSLNPSFETTMQQNMEHFSASASIYNQQIEKTKNNLMVKQESSINISIEKLMQQPHKQTFLFEILSPFGFSNDTVNKIIDSASKEPGRLFYSQSYKILIDRKFIILEEKTGNISNYVINRYDEFTNLPVKIAASLVPVNEFKMIMSDSVACLDYDAIKFPLILRKWESGDCFYPLGMEKKKKVSDFFIDQKIDRFQKEKTWLLESERNIVWIVGARIDNRFKVTSETRNILQLILQ